MANLIHCMDGGVVRIVSHHAVFPVMSVHDSFYVSPNDIHGLFTLLGKAYSSSRLWENALEEFVFSGVRSVLSDDQLTDGCSSSVSFEDLVFYSELDHLSVHCLIGLLLQSTSVVEGPKNFTRFSMAEVDLMFESHSEKKNQSTGCVKAKTISIMNMYRFKS